jgi:hypothetical protein
VHKPHGERHGNGMDGHAATAVATTNVSMQTINQTLGA